MMDNCRHAMNHSPLGDPYICSIPGDAIWSISVPVAWPSDTVFLLVFLQILNTQLRLKTFSTTVLSHEQSWLHEDELTFYKTRRSYARLAIVFSAFTFYVVAVVSIVEPTGLFLWATGAALLLAFADCFLLLYTEFTYDGHLEDSERIANLRYIITLLQLLSSSVTWFKDVLSILKATAFFGSLLTVAASLAYAPACNGQQEGRQSMVVILLNLSSRIAITAFGFQLGKLYLVFILIQFVAVTVIYWYALRELTISEWFTEVTISIFLGHRICLKRPETIEAFVPEKRANFLGILVYQLGEGCFLLAFSSYYLGSSDVVKNLEVKAVCLAVVHILAAFSKLIEHLLIGFEDCIIDKAWALLAFVWTKVDSLDAQPPDDLDNQLLHPNLESVNTD